jgi:hypothetical protein
MKSFYFTVGAEFPICGRVSRHQSAICSNEPPREYVEHEQCIPKTNMWCALTHGRVICPVLFYEDITSNSFLNMLENFVAPHLINSFLFNWRVYLLIFLIFSVKVTFTGRWRVGEGETIGRPPLSPDFTL